MEACGIHCYVLDFGLLSYGFGSLSYGVEGGRTGGCGILVEVGVRRSIVRHDLCWPLSTAGSSELRTFLASCYFLPRVLASVRAREIG